MKKSFDDDYFEKLERITNLKNNGAITQKEYTKQKEKLDKQKKMHSSSANTVAAIISLFVIIGLITWGVLAINSSSTQEETPKPQRYEYKLLNKQVLDPASVGFSMEISNPTDINWENPSCTVTMQNSTGTYKGYDTFTLGESIPPLSSKEFTGSLVITNEGAAYVDQYKVQCQ